MNNSIICIGELIIDFFCEEAGKSLQDGNNFVKQGGGAPANVCATISKLGGKAYFAGKVGTDSFGFFLKNILQKHNVETNLLKFDQTKPTTIAFVSRSGEGERDFIFYRGADQFYTKEEMDMTIFHSSTFLHFGSATALLENPFRETYLDLLEEGKKRGKFISFDPNFRSHLWQNHVNEFKNLAMKCTSYAHLVKVSEEELEILTDSTDVEKGVDLLHEQGAKVITVTLGERGTFLSSGITKEIIDTIQVETVDTTGAGDAFVGAMLYQLANMENPKEVIHNFEKMKRLVRYSNVVGALVTTKVGAITGIPTLTEIETALSSNEK